MTNPSLLRVALATLLAAVLVGVVRHFAVRRSILDHPNERSSHTVSTPRGGGLGLILAFGAAAWLTIGVDHLWRSPRALLATLGVMVVALVGWLDDRASLSVRLRISVHLLASLCVALLLVPGLPGTLSLLVLLQAAWWVFVSVSAINVINFMDGIDGIIGSQIAIFSAYLFAMAPRGLPVSGLALLLAGSCLGFLLWNWAPARIFLGDVGSGPLGLLAVLLGGLVWRDTNLNIIVVFLPLYFLVLDSTLTLLRRAYRGENVTVPHRTHLYQRLANGGWGHAYTSLLYAAAASVGAGLGMMSPGQPQYLSIGTYLLVVLGVTVLLARRYPVQPSVRRAA